MEKKIERAPLDSEFSITRTFEAPREIIFKMWTDPKQMVNWFGPKGCEVGTSKMDLRPEGIYHYSLKMPDGNEMWGKWIFQEVVAPERLVWIHSFSDERGGLTHHPMSPTWPLELLTTTTFEAVGNKTKVTLKWLPINASEVEINTFKAGRAGATVGWTGSFDQLDEYLKTIL